MGRVQSPSEKRVEAGGWWERGLAYPGAPSSVSRGACRLSFRVERTGVGGGLDPPPRGILHTPAFSLFLSPRRHHILFFLTLKCPLSSLSSTFLPVLIQTP